MVTNAVRLGDKRVPLCSLVFPLDNVKRFVEIKTPLEDGGSRGSSFLLQLLTAEERQEEDSQVTA